MSTDLDTLHDQVIDLQERLAFQEHTIGELNDALTAQQTRIEQLQARLEGLGRRLREMPLGEPPGEEPPPPHY